MNSDTFDKDILDSAFSMTQGSAIRSLFNTEPIDLETMILRTQKSLLHLADVISPGKIKELRRLVYVFEDIKMSLKKNGIE